MSRQNDPDFENEEVTVTLNTDMGDIECRLVTVYTVDGKDYAALLPLTGPDAEKGDVYLYRYTVENGEPELGYIDDDDEYEAASDGFDEYLDSAEFDELVVDEEE